MCFKLLSEQGRHQNNLAHTCNYGSVPAAVSANGMNCNGIIIIFKYMSSSGTQRSCLQSSNKIYSVIIILINIIADKLSFFKDIMTCHIMNADKRDPAHVQEFLAKYLLPYLPHTQTGRGVARWNPSYVAPRVMMCVHTKLLLF